MKLNMFVIDAFTDKQFYGNSAAVVPLSEWLTPELMQKIALENNLSETAFIKEVSKNTYEIRWFSPMMEIDFCGHATLAASFVLFNHFDCIGKIEYITQNVGSLTVMHLNDNRIEMSFPIQSPEAIESIPDNLINGLSIRPIEVLKNRQAYFAVMASEDDVLNIAYQSEELKKLAPLDVVVTAKGEKYDFVSRYFWPANGGDEDPVTGSIHSGLAPYWAAKLSKTNMTAYQASNRSGVLFCKMLKDRVLVSGYGVLYLQGTIFI